MTLDQLRIFVAVAERQHVTRAAEALNLVQSAVSAAISAMSEIARLTRDSRSLAVRTRLVDQFTSDDDRVRYARELIAHFDDQPPEP